MDKTKPIGIIWALERIWEMGKRKTHSIIKKMCILDTTETLGSYGRWKKYWTLGRNKIMYIFVKGNLEIRILLGSVGRWKRYGHWNTAEPNTSVKIYESTCSGAAPKILVPTGAMKSIKTPWTMHN